MMTQETALCLKEFEDMVKRQVAEFEIQELQASEAQSQYLNSEFRNGPDTITELTSDATFDDMRELNLNSEFMAECERLENPLQTIMGEISNYIDTLRHASGRKIRIERRDSMIQILNILYQYALGSVDGTCAPSMRRIATIINPALSLVTEEDSSAIVMAKERAMAPTLMLVQRTIETLKEQGLIRIHLYRSETNRNDNPDEICLHLPNFFYELVPVSCFCQAIKNLMKPIARVFTKLESVFCHAYEILFKKEDVRREGLRQVCFERSKKRLAKQEQNSTPVWLIQKDKREECCLIV